MKHPKFSFSLAAAAIALAGVGASAQQPAVKGFQLGYGGFISNVSQNALWGVATPPEGEYITKAQLLDFVDGKVITLPINNVLNHNGTVYDYFDPEVEMPVSLSAVSEDGKIVAGSYNGFPGYLKDGVFQLLEIPRELRGWNATVKQIRGGNKYIVGMAYNLAFDIKPMLWIDDEIVNLPNLPKADWKGHALDAETEASNMSFIDISNDGKTLLGGMSTNHPGWGCCYFWYDMESGEWNYIGAEEIEEKVATGKYFEQSEVTSAFMSEDGKTIAGEVLLVTDNGTQFPSDYYYPYIFDVETKKFTILENPEDRSHGVNVVTNNGDLVGLSDSGAMMRNVAFRKDGRWYTLEDILSQTYGVNFQQATGYKDETSGVCFGMSSDGTLMAGMLSNARDDMYSVRLTDGRSFFDATAGINFLSRYAVAPGAGQSVAVLDQLQILFETSCDVAKDAKAYIKDGETVVAESTEIVAYNAEKRGFIIRFPKTNIPEGKTYTVEVPEGTFEIADMNMKSKPVSVSYVGREEKPLKPVDIQPEASSSMSEISTTNPVDLTFEYPVQNVKGIVGKIYLNDNEAPLSDLYATISGNIVSVYPSAARKLMKGSKYRIEIEEGAFADITGYCPSEAVKAEYEGAYVVSSAEGSDVLFSEDFNNVSAALAHFLLYEGDNLEPVKTMEDIGFDQSNTPWNFSTRDSQTSEDYFASSHSMYKEGGKSDDWMVLPMLNIANKGTELRFDAQGYDPKKQDRLKIVVWESNEVFGTLSQNEVNKMKTEGKVIFDEVVSAGPTLNADGEWTSYKLPLDNFLGKNVYIAFVNENENQSMVFVNNLVVRFEGTYNIASETKEVVVDQSSAPVSGKITILNDKTYDTVKATLTSNGKTVSEYSKTGLSLKKGDIHEFTFPEELKLAWASSTPYEINVTLADETQSRAGVIKNLLFEPVHRVVVEEITGLWCGNCPQGSLAIENMEKLFPGQVVAVAIHNNDNLAYGAYEAIFSEGGYPRGYVNRINYTEASLAPMLSESFSSPEGGTFLDVAFKEFERGVDAQVEVAEYNRADNGDLNITAYAKSAIRQDDANYAVFCAIVEDGVMGVQANYLAGNTNPIYGKWTSMSSNAVVENDHVARLIAGNSFLGESKYLPKEIKPGVSYPIEITIPASTPLMSTVNKFENTRAIVMLLDQGTGKVINAGELKLGGESGVEDIEDGLTPEDVKPVFEVSNGVVTLNGSTENLEIYNLQGQRIANGEVVNGLYIVRGITANGKTAAAKIMVR